MAEAEELHQDNDDLYEDEDTQKDRFLTFHLAGEDYGIAIAHVIEIIGIQKITEVPDMPPFIKGVINLRGSVIPVMDVRIRFNLEPRDYDTRTCIIVVEVKDTKVGLVVDQVNEVADIPENQIEPAPKTGKKSSSRFIQGMGKINDEVKILLRIEELLLDNDELTITDQV